MRHTPRGQGRAPGRSAAGMLGLETALALVLSVTDLTTALRLLSWGPAAIAGLGERHGGPIAAGRPATCASSIRPPRGRSIPGGWRAAVATRPTPAGSSPAGSATRWWTARRSWWTARPRYEGRLLVLADGEVFEGEAVVTWPGGHRRAGVQHRPVGLPGGDNRPVLRRPGGGLHVPHIGNYGTNAFDDESARRGAPASWCATW